MKVSAESSSPGRPLDVALLEAGIELFQERGLLGAEFERLLGVLALERQPALVARAEALIVEDLLDGDRRQAPACQGQEAPRAGCSHRPMQQRQRLEPGHHLGRRRRVALGDRRQVLEAVEAFGLEAPLPVVETGAVDLVAPAGLGDIAQPLGQLQHRHPAVRQLLDRVLGGDPLPGGLCHPSPPLPTAWTIPDRKTRRLRKQIRPVVNPARALRVTATCVERVSVVVSAEPIGAALVVPVFGSPTRSGRRRAEHAERGRRRLKEFRFNVATGWRSVPSERGPAVRVGVDAARVMAHVAVLCRADVNRVPGALSAGEGRAGRMSTGVP